MPKAAAPVAPAPQAGRQGSGRDGAHQPEDAWSGTESGSEPVDQNGSSASRGLKRKRPLTVS